VGRGEMGAVGRGMERASGDVWGSGSRLRTTAQADAPTGAQGYVLGRGVCGPGARVWAGWGGLLRRAPVVGGRGW